VKIYWEIYWRRKQKIRYWYEKFNWYAPFTNCGRYRKGILNKEIPAENKLELIVCFLISKKYLSERERGSEKLNQEKEHEMAIVIRQDEINILVYKYLLEAGNKTKKTSQYREK